MSTQPVKYEWLGYVLAYIMWIVVMALGVWFILVSREGLTSALALYVAGGRSLQRFFEARFLDKVYIVAVGLLWLALVVVAEDRLRKGVRQRRLLRRFAGIAGLELVLIFVADALLLWVQGGRTGWARWLILSSELLAGIGLLVCSRLSRTPKPSG
ncbi:MAG: hypothetical protein N2508_03030 [Anaerolineae bacterium]|nr:hypothetical protein [Anaerolineae bacterium]